MTKISSNLKFLRSQKGLSQTAMAEAVGLKRGNIASYEKELAQPSIENLVKIADFFGVDIHQIVNDDLQQLESHKEMSDKVHFSLFEDKFSFQGLKDRVAALKSNHPSSEKLQQLNNQNQEIFKMVEGFKAYHKMRMHSAKAIDPLSNKIAADYDNVLEILELVLKSNKDLIAILNNS